MAHQPLITKTCLALRAELLLYYYSTRVHISIGSSLGPSLLCSTSQPTIKAIGRWLQAIGADNRACLPAITCVTRHDEGKKVGKLLSWAWKLTLRPERQKEWEEPTALVGIDRPTRWVKYKVKLKEPEERLSR